MKGILGTFSAFLVNEIFLPKDPPRIDRTVVYLPIHRYTSHQNRPFFLYVKILYQSHGSVMDPSIGLTSLAEST